MIFRTFPVSIVVPCSSALLLLLGWFPGTVRAEVLVLTEAPFSAKGDGRTDDRPALAKAFQEAEAGDTVLVPEGDYRVTLTGGGLVVPEGVTLLGVGGKSRFLLGTNGSETEYREFLKPRSGVTLEGLGIIRDEGFTGILLPISGDAENIAVRHCRIDGNVSRFERACHAFRVGYGEVRGLVLEGVTVENCSYGLFQPNEATGTLEKVRVTNCRFVGNASTDLEFNAPKGTMRDVVVRDCLFRDNRSPRPSGGFAVGFANVKGGRVENCLIRNYGSEALHVEDRSEDIVLEGNTIVGASLRQPNGVILVVNDSRRITIVGNLIDGRPNTNRPHLVLVTAGGKSFQNPSGVVVRDNLLVNGAQTRTWYLQEGSSGEPEGNRVVPFSEGEERQGDHTPE